MTDEVVPLDDKPPGPTFEGYEDFAEPEGVAVALRCGKLLDSLRCIPACHGLGIARACVEDRFPEPERFGRITALLGQDGEVAQGQVAVDALVDATELVGTLSPLATRRFPHIYWPRTTGHWPLAAFPTFTGH